MSAPATTPGQRIGPYEVVRLLGRGGMGEVWEAVLHGPAGFRKPVALKVLRPERISKPETLEALQREARLGARLHHPNIVGTLGLSEHDGRWVIALELVRGPSIARRLRREGPLPPREVVHLGEQVAAGLAHAHEAGLVHRDIKPGNLLCDPSGLIKIADLGVSVLAGGLGRPAGTPRYMPPEQREGRAEARSDLFALGVTLLHALGARSDSTGIDRAEALLPGLGPVLSRCLDPAPGARWPSATALRAALSHLAVRVAVSAPSGAASEAASGEHLPSDTPTLVRPSGNLQAPRDRFVGRTDELGELREVLADEATAVVTLLGPGGTGKTRLALQLLRATAHRHDLGTVAVDLTEARDAEGICAVVGRVLGVQAPDRDALSQLGALLAARGPVIVLLDNVEQCVEALPDTLGSWVRQAPDARFLLTSRVAPALVSQRLIPVDPLPLEDAELLLTDRLGRPLRRGEDEAVRALCAAVEGLPLAVELAAARARLIGVAAVHERLSVALLSGGGGDRPERHRSIAASLAWSAELLSDPGLDALLQLSVFEGSFSLEAGEAVLDVGGAAQALELLQELADASLLRVDAASGRFSMLQVVRQWARGELDAEAAAAAEVRHGAYFAEIGGEPIGRAYEPGWRSRRPRELAPDLWEHVAACRRAMARGDVPVAVATVEAASRVLDRVGPLALRDDLVMAVRSMPGLDEVALARIEQLEMGARYGLGQEEEALRVGRSAAARCEALGELRASLAVRAEVGLLLRFLGRLDEAHETLLAALDEALASCDPVAEMHVRSHRVMVLSQRGRHDEAAAEAARCVELARRLGDPAVAIDAMVSWAEALFFGGRTEEAGRVAREGAAAAGREGQWQDRGTLCEVLAQVERRLGDYEASLRFSDEAIASNRKLGQAVPLGMRLHNRGVIEHDMMRLEQAVRFFSESRAIWRSLGRPYHEARTVVMVAAVHLDGGDVAGALRLARQADETLADRDAPADRQWRARAAWVRSRALLERGEPEDAHHLAGEAVTRAEPLSPFGYRTVAQLHHQLARCALIRGALDAAEAHLQDARAHRDWMARGERVEADSLTAWLTLARGDEAGARSMLDALQEALVPGHALAERHVAALRERLAAG